MNKNAIIPLILLMCLIGAIVSIFYPRKRKTSGNPWALAKSYKVRGLDLSHWNGKVIYDELESLDFVFLKVSQGNSLVDRMFDQHYQEFRERDVAVGAYHFFSFGVDGREQALHYLNQLDGRQLQLPLTIDVEQDGNPRVPYQQVRKELRAFMNEIEKHTQYKPIIYTNGNGYTNFIENDFDDCTLWLSSTNTWRPQNMNCTFWQFNMKADLMAITHEVDLNVFRGSREEWEEYLSINKPYVLKVKRG